jgi:U3 small nucleolar RNA-associated protein 20
MIAPLLGKQRQQPHIARFAAEAMSFLVKKAGTPTHREKALPLLVEHAKSDLQSMSNTKQFGLYYHGLMTMFAEAIKGNGLTVHTSGPAIFKSLILLADEEDLLSPLTSLWMDVICGVLTSILHHTSSDTFKSTFEVILEIAPEKNGSAAPPPQKGDVGRLLLSSRMLGTVAAVRKGTRVDDWSALLQTMSAILKAISPDSLATDGHVQDLALWKLLILSAAISLQYSPMDAVIPFISQFMDSLTKDPLAKWFLAFCSYFSYTDPDRFRSMVQPSFQRCVISARCNFMY